MPKNKNGGYTLDDRNLEDLYGLPKKEEKKKPKEKKEVGNKRNIPKIPDKK